ncbi:MAG: zinc-ribbon domain-containing protein, partial [Undibacterium sp.]|nr:zinc-ribbon domain-containing protein [Undibacterium sp.]
MALATQCPHCHTSFRVANDQLKLHAGLVRCGQCQQTFDGIAHLLGPDGLPQNAATASESAATNNAENTAENTTANASAAAENFAPNAEELLSHEAHDDAPVPTALRSEPITEPITESIAELPTALPTEPASELVSEASIASLDFDLGDDDSDQDREWNQHAKEAEQLALQTRAALSHEDSPEWSRKEPNFAESATSEIPHATASHQVTDEISTDTPSMEP